MRKAALILLLACPAGAAEITGGDWHGGDLVPANYDILRGTFTNVGNFTIAYGNTVLVSPGERLAVYAATATIAGHLNASGSGLPGGAAGGSGLPGSDGFSPVAGGAGKGGLATYGGGGGGHAKLPADTYSGGQGAPTGLGGLGGLEYDLDTALDIPLSAADAYLGAGGGGGGGGGDALDQSGGGGSGGGAVYIEAGYVVVSGTISANGQVGGVGITTAGTPPSGSGGGGAGGTVLIKSAGGLKLANGSLSSSGGAGGAAINGHDPLTPNPGGGGAAGRIRVVYNSADFGTVNISTAGGAGGESNFLPGTAIAGSSGTVSIGLFPSSPAAFAVADVFKTSATYTWTGKAGADWGGPVSNLPALTIEQFRVYASTTAVPFSSYYTGFYAAGSAATLTETGLTPNSALARMLTAYTDYGDSAPSSPVSFITKAAAPQGSGFISASTGSVTFSWAAGSAADGFNPGYTTYEVTSSSVPGFASAVNTAPTVGLSSAPAGLAPNTTYYFKARAQGLDGTFTGYTMDFSTPTLALDPASPALSGVYLSSVVFSWSGAGNPPGTLFEAQLSENGFVGVTASSLTLATTALFDSLTPGSIYSLRVRAINYAGRQTAFTLVLSTTAGQLGDMEAPGRPEPPNPTSAYSYDGKATFVWSPPAGAVPIYSYLLDIGTNPGGSDLGSDAVLASSGLSYSTNTLVSGKTYYARVRARSTAGVLGEYSLPGTGVAAWAPQAQPAVVKPYNWPNPFDPGQGATNIAFSLSDAARVTLTIYTLQGRRVREISASEGSSGNKIWTWDGRNGEGRVVEPGGYLAVIKKDYGSGSQTQRFKIAVLY